MQMKIFYIKDSRHLRSTVIFAAAGLLLDQMWLSIITSVRMDYYVGENGVFDYAVVQLLLAFLICYAHETSSEIFILCLTCCLLVDA